MTEPRRMNNDAVKASHHCAWIDGPCWLSKRRLQRRAAGHRLDDPSRRRDVDGRACAGRNTCPGDSDRRCARRRPRRPVGASLTDDDRQAAWQAQVGALDLGQKRSWRGAKGVFGFVEPGSASGDGCRAYSQTVYVAGRPKRGKGVGCRQPDGSLEDDELRLHEARLEPSALRIQAETAPPRLLVTRCCR